MDVLVFILTEVILIFGAAAILIGIGDFIYHIYYKIYRKS
jgi:hypothetical protein